MPIPAEDRVLPQPRSTGTDALLPVRIWRGDANGRFERYDVPRHASQTVLDVVSHVQRHVDATLAYRYACRVGMCGSCAMTVNGKARWTCRTHVDAVVGAATLEIAPLNHLPIVRDLVVDMAPFADRQRRVGAAFAPAPAAPPYAEIPSASAERQAIDDAIECIGCAMCLSACTMVAANARFPGPAALNRAFTVQRDRRDAAHETRWATLLSEEGLTRCHGQASCTDVCPMGLSPTDSILRLRRMAVRRMVSGRDGARLKAAQVGSSGGGTDGASRANSLPG